MKYIIGIIGVFINVFIFYVGVNFSYIIELTPSTTNSPSILEEGAYTTNMDSWEYFVPSTMSAPWGL